MKENTKNEAVGALVTPATATQDQDLLIVAPTADSDKTTDNLIANLALRGFATHRLADGGYLVCRWNLARNCPDLRALAIFARTVGATS